MLPFVEVGWPLEFLIVLALKVRHVNPTHAVLLPPQPHSLSLVSHAGQHGHYGHGVKLVALLLQLRRRVSAIDALVEVPQCAPDGYFGSSLPQCSTAGDLESRYSSAQIRLSASRSVPLKLNMHRGDTRWASML